MGQNLTCLNMCVNDLDIQAELVLGCKTIIGKNLVWDEKLNCLLWIDIESSKFWIFDHSSKIHHSIDLEGKPGSFALTKGKGKVLLALERRLTKLTLNDEKIDTLTHFDRNTAVPTSRPNDGRCDRNGNFIVLGLNEPGQYTTEKGRLPDTTGLYSIGGLGGASSSDTKMHSILKGLPCIDGICFNKAGDIMYMCNATKREILMYDYNIEDGTLYNERRFYKMAKEMPGFPSGATVDTEDYLWSAHCGRGKVVRHAPNGEIVGVVELPVENPTALAFGGPNFEELFIITSRFEEQITDVAKYTPSAGGLFVAKIPNVRGLPEPRFKGDIDTKDQCLIS